MALPPGARLGPYAIAAQIGAGGMGEIYRARSRSGRELFFRVGGRMMVAPVTPGATFTAGTPRVLFEGQ